MPDRRGFAVLDDLPDDIVVGKILILLPPKDVGRCRVVRKSWRGATSTPEFVLEHRHRQPSLPIIDGRGRPASLVLLGGAKASSEKLWPFPTSRPGCRKFCCEIRLHAACDGFLIVSRGVRFYICNPTIRRHALLPFPRPHQPHPTGRMNDSCIHGFYRHKSTGEYRVLWSRIQGLTDRATLHVLTLGDNESRSIQVVTPALPSQMFEICYKLYYSSPAQHGGNLHWYLRWPRRITGSTGDIIVFDTEAESFRWMSSPAPDPDPARRQGLMSTRRVFDMEGTLAFQDVCDISVKLWVLQDYEAEIWAFKCRIDLSMIQASRPLDLTSREERKRKKLTLDSTVSYFSTMAMLNETELLIGFNGRHVLRCDTDGKFLQMVTIGKRQYCMKLTTHRLQQSIMPISSIGMKEEDEEFPFSTEHV